MNVFSFLITRTIKNAVISLKEKPGRLVLYIILAAVMIFGMVVTMLAPQDETEMLSLNINYLGAIIYAIALLFAGIALVSGTGSAGSFFIMSDVHFLFPSPLRSQSVLMYGIFKQLGKFSLVSIFILYQTSTLKMIFNATNADIVFLFIGFVLALFLCQIITIFVFSICSRFPLMKKGFPLLLILALAALAFDFIQKQKSGVAFGTIILNWMENPILTYFPVTGFLKMAVFEGILGNVTGCLLGFGVTIATAALLLWAVTKSNIDYYEDVLSSAEKVSKTLSAQKEGKVYINRDKKKIKSSGFSNGAGANMFFFKQLRTLNRGGYFWFADIWSILSLILVVVFSSISFDEEKSILPSVAICAYMLLISSINSCFADELKQPFLFLVPENPTKKLFWASLESTVKNFFDALLCFTVAGIMTKTDILIVAGCILAYTFFSHFLTVISIFVKKITGTLDSMGLIRTINILIAIFTAMPGIGVGIFLVITIAPIVGLLAMCAYLSLLSLLFLFICRNMLHNMEG